MGQMFMLNMGLPMADKDNVRYSSRVRDATWVIPEHGGHSA